MKYRPYQKRMIKAADKFIKSKLTRALTLAATGAGKTEVFIDTIEKSFAAGRNRILIAHPRIALSQDQQKRLATRLAGWGVEFTSFHSGHQKYHTLADRKNVSTTNREGLIEILDAATGPHITFSSYKSLHKIADLDFDLTICDEAHYLVQSDLRECLHKFGDNKVMFYTGTPVEVAAAEESMDNPELFGEVIATVPPSELIPKGFIVPPRIRSITAVNKKNGNTPDYARLIGEAMKDQVSLAHDKFNHKMLVALSRTREFDDIMDQLKDIRTYADIPELDLYYVTASTAVKNGKVMADRETCLSDFGANPNKCVIIHCDTLAEGIDVDGLGGILIMRGLGMAKGIQTMGRGCRPAKADVLPSGNIRKNRIKTECIVTLVNVDGEWYGDTDIADWAEMFKVAGYGDIWDFYKDDPTTRGTCEEEGMLDWEDPMFDSIDKLVFSDGVKSMFKELFDVEV